MIGQYYRELRLSYIIQEMQLTSHNTFVTSVMGVVLCVCIFMLPRDGEGTGDTTRALGGCALPTVASQPRHHVRRRPVVGDDSLDLSHVVAEL